MDSWPAWVRWVLVVPASLVGVAFCAVSYILAYLALYHGQKPQGLPPFSIAAPFFCSALFIWCGIAAAPRFKFAVALILSLAPLWLAYQDYATRAAGLHLVGPYVWQANDLFSYLLHAVIALIGGVVVAWGLALWGYLRRRQVRLSST